MRSLLLAGALSWGVMHPAFAHTPYLVPSDFAPRAGQTIALDAAFAETFFTPEVAFDGSPFSVTTPGGRETSPDAVHVMKTRAVAEYTLPANAKGTYRLSTGPRPGALFRTWEIDGKRESTRDPAVKIPAGAKVISDFQSLTLAETYVSVGAPDRTALAARNKGLEFLPVTHPDDVYVGEPFVFIVQYDGKPLAGQKVEITEAVWTSDRKPHVERLTSDGQGKASFTPKGPGTWLALSRYRSTAPAGAPVPEYSNSYTLSFHALNP